MNLNLITPINSFGHGVTGVNILKALVRAKVKVTLFAMGQVAPERKDLGVVEAHRFNELKVMSYDADAPSVRNYHEYDVWFPPGKGPKIAWPFFETDKLYKRAVSLLNSCDAIAAGSEWAEAVMRNNGVTTTCFKANQGVNMDTFYPADTSGPPDTYKFFTLGKFEVRKGHYELITAFKEAFPNEDDVRLYMMCHNPFIDSKRPGFVVKEIQNASNNDRRIIFAPPVPTQSEVAAFINRCHCGVFPSRGEGWGLPMLETLACGKPLLATFITAQTEYLDLRAATEISTLHKEVANDGMFFHGDRGNWHAPDIKDMAEKMRHMYDSRKTDNPEGEGVARLFSWDRAAGMLLDGIAGL